VAQRRCSLRHDDLQEIDHAPSPIEIGDARCPSTFRSWSADERRSAKRVGPCAPSAGCRVSPGNNGVARPR
jgi:hypothetical protein